MESEIFVTGSFPISRGEKTSKDLPKPVEKFVPDWGPKREDLGFAHKLDGIYVKTEENGIFFDITSDIESSESSSEGAAAGGGGSHDGLLAPLKTILSERSFKKHLDDYREPVEETSDLSIEEADARTIARATKYKRTIMHQAIIDGNVALVRKGVELGYIGHKIELRETTTLHLAAALGNKEIFQILYDRTSPVDGTSLDRCQRGPLHVAAAFGNLEIVEFILKDKALLDSTDIFDWTPLHYALNNGIEEVAIYLVENGANFGNNSIQGIYPFHMAIDNDLTEVVKLMLSGIKPRISDLKYAMIKDKLDSARLMLERGVEYHEETILHEAIISGKIEFLELFLNYGIGDVNQENEMGSTPLLYAIKSGSSDAVRALLAKGADIHKPVNKISMFDDKISGATEGLKYIHIAAMLGKTDVVMTLLEFGAIIDQKDIHGFSPIHYAAASGQLEAVSALLDSEANIEELNINGASPLLIAAKYGNLNIVEFLIEKGANKDHKDNNSSSLIHYAAESNNAELIEKVLELEFSINELDILDRSPLMHAAISNNEISTKFLLEKGAKLDLRDKNGAMAIHLAAESGSIDALESLIEAGYIDEGDNDGKTPLMYAVAGIKDQAAELLLEKGASINKADNKGRSAIFYFDEDSEDRVVITLLRYGADSDLKDNDGYYPAFSEGFLEYFKSQAESYGLKVTGECSGD